MKYASFKNYVEDNYSEYLLNEIKNFLSNENGAVIRNEDVSQFEIKSVFCESLADMNIKITVNVEMNIYRHMNGNATVLISHQPGRQGGWGFSTKDVFVRHW